MSQTHAKTHLQKRSPVTTNLHIKEIYIYDQAISDVI